MNKAISIVEGIEMAEYIIAKYNFVLQHFPDAKMSGPTKATQGYVCKNPVFKSALVNKTYTDFTFQDQVYQLSVIPYTTLTFEYKGKTEEIRISSSPGKSRLARTSSKKDTTSGKWVRVIKFGRVAINFKTHDFDIRMMNKCREAILGFIKKNPNMEIDDKHMDPKLKNLISYL